MTDEATTSPTTATALCENKQALLDEIIATHRSRPGALMVILNEIQRQVGYVSEPIQNMWQKNCVCRSGQCMVW